MSLRLALKESAAMAGIVGPSSPAGSEENEFDSNVGSSDSDSPPVSPASSGPASEADQPSTTKKEKKKKPPVPRVLGPAPTKTYDDQVPCVFVFFAVHE